MMKKEKLAYCYECGLHVTYKTKKETRTITVKNIPVIVDFERAFCDKCGEEVYAEEVERKNDIAVFDAYKKKVGLLTSEEIRAIREIRGMTQTQLADFLCIGKKDIARYENGAIQNKSIDNMLRVLADPEGYSVLKRIVSRDNPEIVIVYFDYSQIDYKLKTPIHCGQTKGRSEHEKRIPNSIYA